MHLKGKQTKEQLFFCVHENYSRYEKSKGGTERQRGAGDRKKQDQKVGWTEEGTENRIRGMSLKRQKTEFQVDLKN